MCEGWRALWEREGCGGKVRRKGIRETAGEQSISGQTQNKGGGRFTRTV